MSDDKEFATFIQDSLAENMYTEDVPALLRKDLHYVFVYNQRRGKHSNYLIHEEDAEFVSFAWTKSKIYEILKVEANEKTYPLASVLGQDQILGELWLVTTELLLDMDCDEANCFITKRFETSIELPNGQVISAWIYIGNRKWMDRHKSSTTKYTGVTYVGPRRFIELHT